jgi:hypothetical protein
LFDKIAALDPNAIVRLSGIDEGGIAAGLTASFLRSVFPDTMTVELAMGLRTPSRGLTSRAPRG